MVALAVLMPIVASMGGNAGTQTMTVAVRALATRELGRANAWRVVRRELLVGVLNGLGFAVIMGTIAALWFNVTDLGLVIALAMVTVLAAAALGGILIPLLLVRLGVDPAVSSGPVRHHRDRCRRFFRVPRDCDAVVVTPVAGCRPCSRSRIG